MSMYYFAYLLHANNEYIAVCHIEKHCHVDLTSFPFDSNCGILAAKISGYIRPANMRNYTYSIQFNSIQNSLFSTQHIVHTAMFFAYDVLKRERAEDSGYVGSFPNIII